MIQDSIRSVQLMMQSLDNVSKGYDQNLDKSLQNSKSELHQLIVADGERGLAYFSSFVGKTRF